MSPFSGCTPSTSTASSCGTWENERRTEVVTTGPGWAISYDLEGKELWRMSRMSRMTIQSPFAWDGLVYVAAGAAKEQDNQTAGGNYLPTPLVYDGGLYALSDRGIFSRLDPKTGEQTYKARLHRTARNFTASPWAYNGMIFCLNEEGNTFVVKAGEEFELLGINSLDEFAMATPALAGGRLLIRTQGKLYSIRGDAEATD